MRGNTRKENNTMGYRSTFVTDDTGLKIPEWFIDKWPHTIHWNIVEGEARFPLASKCEMKEYGHWNDLMPDIQRILKEGAAFQGQCIHLVFLHEDGLHTKYHIYADHVEDENERTSA